VRGSRGSNKKVLKLQGRAPSLTESKEYAGRTHFMAGMDGGEEIADYALDWALQHARDGAPATGANPAPAPTGS
jgi:hypothetical protein